MALHIYGLCAFWLVPSYFKVTAANMKFVSEHGTTWSIWLAVAVALFRFGRADWLVSVPPAPGQPPVFTPPDHGFDLQKKVRRGAFSCSSTEPAETRTT